MHRSTSNVVVILFGYLSTYIIHNNGKDNVSITLAKHIWQIKHLASGHWSVEADKRGVFFVDQ